MSLLPKHLPVTLPSQSPSLSHSSQSAHLLSRLVAQVDEPDYYKPYFEISIFNEVCHVTPKQPVNFLRRKGLLAFTIL